MKYICRDTVIILNVVEMKDSWFAHGEKYPITIQMPTKDMLLKTLEICGFEEMVEN